MLDVHPPHNAAHTFRDFFLHIATIVVGLLIAVGLEQTVESLHHRHQLHQLQEDLLAEAEHNHAIVLQDLKIYGHTAWIQQALDATSSAHADNKLLQIVLPVAPCRAGTLNTPDFAYFAPSESVWAAARESGLTALIPAPEARVYNRLEHNLDLANLDRTHTAEACDRMVALQRRLSIAAPGNQNARLWRLTPQQAESLSQAAADLDTAVRGLVYRMRAVRICEEAIIDHVLDVNQLMDKISKIDTDKLDPASLP